MSDERFAAYTRSASFALTLSAAQIDYLQSLIKTRELVAKYPWYRPRAANFGTAEEAAVMASTSTVRALARKGLVDVNIRPLPTLDCEIVTPTRAGELLGQLLIEAGFEPRGVDHVPPHPDDRVRITVGVGDFGHELPEQDRRDPADAQWHARPYPMPTVRNEELGR